MTKMIGQLLSEMHTKIEKADRVAYNKAALAPKCMTCWMLHMNTPGSQFQSPRCAACTARTAKIEVDRLRAHWLAKNAALLQLVTLKAVVSSGPADERLIDREIKDLQRSLGAIKQIAEETKENAKAVAP